MNSSLIYINVAIISLVVICFLVFLRNKDTRNTKFSRTASIAFGFILAGIFFGENRLIGYSLFGVGIILSVVDIYKQKK